MMHDDLGRRDRSWSRRLTALVAAGALAVQFGCHSYSPVQESVPTIGREIAVELNDRGRLMVAGRLGESVLRVEGRLTDSTSSEVTLSVARTVLMQGSSVVWTGESVAIPREGIRHFRLREFSRSRTAMLTAGVALLVGAAIAGFSILGVAGGRSSDDGDCPPNCNER